MQTLSVSLPATPPEQNLSKIQEFRKVATALEASFLAEMLKFGGLGESRDSFGGGAGEEAFSSLLVQEQATLMAEHGGIGLAEHIVESLMRRDGI